MCGREHVAVCTAATTLEFGGATSPSRLSFSKIFQPSWHQCQSSREFPPQNSREASLKNHTQTVSSARNLKGLSRSASIGPRMRWAPNNATTSGAYYDLASHVEDFRATCVVTARTHAFDRSVKVGVSRIEPRAAERLPWPEGRLGPALRGGTLVSLNFNFGSAGPSSASASAPPTWGSCRRSTSAGVRLVARRVSRVS